jgi:acylpyruvate hydrolase
VKLVTFVHDNSTRLGALKSTPAGEMVIDLNRADSSLPTDMIAFLEGGSRTHALAAKALAVAPASALLPLASVTLKAPILRPGKIMCLGYNYQDHAAELKAELPKYPIIFAKYGNCVIGPGEAIVLPKVSSSPDYEAELAVVIGRRAKNVAAADALGYVGGYTCCNDVSARDWQFRTSQWTIGKTFDTFAPMGPVLVTADEIADPQTLDIKLSIGGEVLQSSNTRYLIFTVADIIAYLSSVMTLEPGDVISTGTPSGVGDGRTPKRWLKPGEVVRIEIAGIGVLENPIVAET